MDNSQAKPGDKTFADFEPYQLLQVQLTDNKLGHGSYATVMEVKYMGLKCAGKVIHEVLLEQGDKSYTICRFEEECRMLSRIRHPNIVQFLGVYYRDNMKVPILVMEFLPMNLTSCIDKHGILPAETSYSILRDVALGLCYLHNQSPPIVHRDLSANNVLLTRNMEAKISDLGVARMLNLTPLQASRMTQTPGTPAYMPPEVMVRNPTYNTSIDEFSYGIMMIHIFSGRWPEPECSQIRMEDGLMIPVTEAGRRESFLKAIGDDHPLMSVILQCIHNDPRQRMPIKDILKKVAEMASQCPKRQPLVIIQQLHQAVGKMPPAPKLGKQTSHKDNPGTANEKRSIEDSHASTKDTPTEKGEAHTQVLTAIEDKKLSPRQVSRSMVELEPWYFGHIDKALASIKCKENGDFLVRYSLNMQQYVISCRWKNTVYHYKMQQTSSGDYFDGSNEYKSLKSFIDFYVTSEKQLGTAGAVLRKPVNKVDKWTMKYTGIEVLNRIGSCSHFGEICEAVDKRTNQRVTTRSYTGLRPESINTFLLDAEALKQCCHRNIVQLIGVCVEPNVQAVSNPVYIVIEHMPGGTLVQYLKNKGTSIKKTQLCRMCIDICKGLEYLHTDLSRTHCNVAARNCLVGEGNVIKVFNLGNSTSFTNSSELKPIPQDSPLPIKWAAPETLNHQRHMLSDIWSFGVLIWETFSQGATPYPSMNNETVVSKVKTGYHMDPPPDCPQEIGRIMLDCWYHDARQRPSFSGLLFKLETAYTKLLSQRTNEI